MNYVGRVLTGAQFNEQVVPLIGKMYKFLHQNMQQKDFQYVEGHNKLTTEFNPTGKCLPGGLYFTHARYVSCWMYYCIQPTDDPRSIIYTVFPLVAELTIPDSSLVYCESKNKFKCTEMIISNLQSIHEFIQSPAATAHAIVKYVYCGHSVSDELMQRAAKINPGLVPRLLDPTTENLLAFSRYRVKRQLATEQLNIRHSRIRGADFNANYLPLIRELYVIIDTTRSSSVAKYQVGFNDLTINEFSKKCFNCYTLELIRSWKREAIKVDHRLIARVRIPISAEVFTINHAEISCNQIIMEEPIPYEQFIEQLI